MVGRLGGLARGAGRAGAGAGEPGPGPGLGQSRCRGAGRQGGRCGSGAAEAAGHGGGRGGAVGGGEVHGAGGGRQGVYTVAITYVDIYYIYTHMHIYIYIYTITHMTSVGFCMYAVHVPFQSRQDVTCACCLRSTQFAILSVFARAEETALILPWIDGSETLET